MAIVRVRENEPSEIVVRRFKRAVEKDGIIMELRTREFYEKPTTERKRKAAAARKRHEKQRLRDMPQPRGGHAIAQKRERHERGERGDRDRG